VTGRLRPPALLLVRTAHRRPVRPLTRLQRGAAQPRHAAPLRPWPVDRWILRTVWVGMALAVAWKSGAIAWAWMWGGTWTVAAAFMVAGVVAG
jgi:hypothetical protein